MIEYNTPYEIYVITSERHWYVGSASGIEPYATRRFNDHMSGSYRSNAKQLQDAIAKYGSAFFSLKVLESGRGDFLAAEQLWYDLGQLFDSRRCLNGKRPFIGGGPGIPRGTTTKAKGVPHSPEWVAKIAAANTGSKRTPEQCANISASLRGKPSPLRGRKHSEQHRRKNSEAHLGLSNGPRSEETKAKISAGNKGD